MSFVQSHIGRGNRNMLLTGIALVLIGGGLAWLFQHWFPLLVLIPGVVVFVFWLVRVVNPKGHPVYKQLARYGEPQQLASDIDREFANTTANDRTLFGEHWLAQGNMFGVDLVPWTAIAWLHVYTIVRNRVPSHHVKVYTRDGSMFQTPGVNDEDRARETMLELHQRASWAEMGYSKDLENEWARHRSDVVARVDARIRRQRGTV